eukprot:gene9138-1437_t
MPPTTLVVVPVPLPIPTVLALVLVLKLMTSSNSICPPGKIRPPSTVSPLCAGYLPSCLECFRASTALARDGHEAVREVFLMTATMNNDNDGTNDDTNDDTT